MPKAKGPDGTLVVRPEDEVGFKRRSEEEDYCEPSGHSLYAFNGVGGESIPAFALTCAFVCGGEAMPAPYGAVRAPPVWRNFVCPMARSAGNDKGDADKSIMRVIASTRKAMNWRFQSKHETIYGAAVAEFLDCSPPTKANRAQSRPARCGFLQVEIVPDDVAGRRIFSVISRFLRPSIPAPLHTHLTSPSSALKSSLEVIMKQDRNARTEETGDFRENPPTSDIVQQYSHMRLSRETNPVHLVGRRVV
ncbi:hypothetical protein PR048_000448 [Dryococelus australis]|uniref:Uncharacterized protein n=1 Tax=Dryococelus australis TaxID=614101 RepID=A0ABQ9IEM8_9NEOP|nr:hypothetical protein PR048_000448 [Dryococelus australis]